MPYHLALCFRLFPPMWLLYGCYIELATNLNMGLFGFIRLKDLFEAIVPKLGSVK